MTDEAPRRTSALAWCCLAALVVGYFAIAVVAGAPRSPLTVLLPAGAHPPSWATDLARTAGLDGMSRDALIGVAWVLVPVVLVAFALLLREAWLGRVRLTVALVAGAISLTIAVAAPLLLSRDVYTYAAWGRIDASHDPYVAHLSHYAHDPFVRVASAQWLGTHSVYGPLFTLVSAGIAKAWAGSVGGTIFAFKLMAGLAIAAATGLAALAALRTRPERAALAAALVGLNPVLVIHTVGGGHVDALIAAPLAGAMAIAVTRPTATSGRAFAITVLLTLACLIKVVIVPALALWLLWVARSSRDRRARIVGGHLALVAAMAIASLLPFVSGWDTLAPFATLGGVESWASPSHLVGSLVGLPTAVTVAFLAFFVFLLWRIARHLRSGDPVPPADTWGVALLALPLSMPYLLPWYAAWFAPFLGLMRDRVILVAGAAATGVLALTLIPADPFHGLTSRAVLDGVHYGAASLLLIALAVVARRVLAGRSVNLASDATPRGHR
jgi:alpha-1,6-mannosyltransferase